MLTDAQLQSCKAQAITTGTQVGNAIDLLSAKRNIGRVGDLRGYVTIDTTFLGGTSLTPKYIESDNADLSSPNVLATGPTIAEAAAVAGTAIWDFALPDNTKRFVGFEFTTVGTHTQGNVTAQIVGGSDYNPGLPANTGFAS